LKPFCTGVKKMNNVIAAVLTLSLSGSLIALLLFALRPVLKGRLSRAFAYYVWLIVLIRLVLPVSFEGSVMDRISLPVSNPNTAVTQAPLFSGVQEQPSAHAVAEDEQSAPPASVPFDFTAFFVRWQIAIWLGGAAACFSWFLLSYLRFERHIRQSCTPPAPEDQAVFDCLSGGSRVKLYRSIYATTPLLIGLFSPRIVLPPVNFCEENMRPELKHILLHELTHYRRKDLLYKWFVVLVCSLHWFNPLMILVRREVGRACELACDEAVVSRLRESERGGYGQTLLMIASGRRLPAGVVTTTMCEEKRALKERLVNIMNYKKKTVQMAALSLAAAVLLTGCSIALGAATDYATPKTVVISQAAENSPGASSSGVPAQSSAVLSASPAASAQPSAQAQASGGPPSAAAIDYNPVMQKGFSGEPYTLLTVSLNNGKSIGMRYPGTWISHVSVGDLAGDGGRDIVLYLEYLGSSHYGMGEAHVLYFTGDKLQEYPRILLKNPEVSLPCPENFAPADSGAFRMLIGADVVREGGHDYLRIKHWLLDKTEDTIQYTLAAYSASGWQITSARTLTGAQYTADLKDN